MSVAAAHWLAIAFFVLQAVAVTYPGFLPFSATLSRHVLGEDLRLPSIATWWCGQDHEFAHVSDLSTWISTVLMWLGRVEIIPVAVVLTRAYWRA